MSFVSTDNFYCHFRFRSSFNLSFFFFFNQFFIVANEHGQIKMHSIIEFTFDHFLFVGRNSNVGRPSNDMHIKVTNDPKAKTVSNQMHDVAPNWQVEMKHEKIQFFLFSLFDFQRIILSKSTYDRASGERQRCDQNH